MAHNFNLTVGDRQVQFTTRGLDRVIMDFDRDGGIEVLTLVTDDGAWRIFADGSTYGTRPDSVSISPDIWDSEPPTRPDIPQLKPLKK